MKLQHTLLVAVGAASLLSACKTAQVYDRTPYDDRTSGRGEVIIRDRDVVHEQKTVTTTTTAEETFETHQVK